MNRRNRWFRRGTEEESFDKHNGFYFAGAQTFEPGPNGRGPGRVGTTFISVHLARLRSLASTDCPLACTAQGCRRQPASTPSWYRAKSFGNVLVGIWRRRHRYFTVLLAPRPRSADVSTRRTGQQRRRVSCGREVRQRHASPHGRGSL